MKRVFFLALSCLWITLCSSQVETCYFPKKGQPLKMSKLLKGAKGVSKVYALPTFDISRLIEEDKEMEGSEIPYRFGKGFDVSLSLADGEWANIDGGRLWTMAFESKGAYSLNFIFKEFSLPEGAFLYIINKEETIIYGPVTSDNIPKRGDFLTDIIEGNNVSICLFEPADKKGESSLVIKRIVHGYRKVLVDMINGKVGSSSSCNTDVACFPNYEKESNGIGLVLLSTGTELCSGALITSTDYSLKPYFLTAFHCIDVKDVDGTLSDYEISNSEMWMFKFCHKKQLCGGNSLATSYTYNGATFRAAYRNTDFALMEIAADLKQNKLLTWLGWDNTGNTPSSGFGIHHPAGDVMKISIEDDSFQTGTWNDANLTNIDYGTNNHWVVDFDEGVTQEGSSGSPIFNQAKRIVGQLHGGPYYADACQQTIGLYGKLNLSWSGGGTNSTRLSNWLDPSNTGLSITNSFNVGDLSLSGSTYLCGEEVFQIQNYGSGMTVNWEIGDAYYANSSTRFKPNYPSAGECTIIPTPLHALDDTLTAYVYAGNTLLQTLKKHVTSSKQPISCQMSYSCSNSGTLPGVANTGDRIEIPTGCRVTLTSTNLQGMTVTKIGTTPSYWNFNGTNIISFELPESDDYQAIKIHGVNSSTCKVFDATFYNGIQPDPVEVEIYNLKATISGTSLSVVLMQSIGTLTPLSQGELNAIGDDFQWTLRINKVSTGLQMYNQTVTGSTKTVSTSGWASGYYIVQAIVDGDVVATQTIKL